MSLREANFVSEDDRTPVLTASSVTQFEPLKTIPIFSVHLLISTTISFYGILIAILWPDSKRCEAYFIMLYLRVAFWFLTLILHHIVRMHHEKLRLNGYIDFNKATKMHRSIPFFIVTLWNNVILIIQSIMYHYYEDKFAEHCIEGALSPIIYMIIFNISECIVLYAVIGSYLARVYKFNKSALPPDAFRGTFSDSSGSVGIVTPQYQLTELCDEQANLISYLKDHTANLNKKLIQLNAELKTFKGEID